LHPITFPNPVPSFGAKLLSLALQSAAEVNNMVRVHNWISNVLFIILLVGGVTACSGRVEEIIPTEVPAAIPLLGPPGTNAVNIAWKRADNYAAGLTIEHPQDWNGRQIEANSILLTPVVTAETSNNNTLTVVASIANISAEQLPPGVNLDDTMAVLEALITNPDLGPANAVARTQPPAPLAISGFTGAAAQLEISSPDVDLPEAESGELGIEDLGSRNTIRMYMAVIQQNGRTAVFTASTNVEMMDTYLPIFTAMLQTVQFSAPVPEE
jgi:hypothetical protein